MGYRTEKPNVFNVTTNKENNFQVGAIPKNIPDEQINTTAQQKETEPWHKWYGRNK